MADVNNPCPQCPWRIANQGKKHSLSFYTKANLTRLWNQVRGGGAPQSCHLTDPSHPDHVKAGCAPTAQVRECPGAVVLVLREFATMSRLGDQPGTISDSAVDEYLAKRKKGLKRNGILYWLILRYRLGGVPIVGGAKLPEVNAEDQDIGLPLHLQENI